MDIRFGGRMLTIQQIDFKIQELLRSVIDETSPEARINRGVIDSLYWLKNNNKPRLLRLNPLTIEIIKLA